MAPIQRLSNQRRSHSLQEVAYPRWNSTGKEPACSSPQAALCSAEKLDEFAA